MVAMYCVGPGPHGPEGVVRSDGFLMEVSEPWEEGLRCPACSRKAELKRKELVGQARAAWNENKTYLALTPPSNADAIAQVRKLTVQMQGVLRLLANVLDE